jgi:hypothetical protein
MASRNTRQVFTPPYTIYAVSLLYFHREVATRFLLTCWMFTVSGHAPLTAEEAAARAQKGREAEWDELDPHPGPLAEWRFAGASANWSVCD